MNPHAKALSYQRPSRPTVGDLDTMCARLTAVVSMPPSSERAREFAILRATAVALEFEHFAVLVDQAAVLLDLAENNSQAFAGDSSSNQ